MKKIITAILAGVSALLVGCSDIVTGTENMSSENSQRRQALAFYAGTGDYTASKSEMEANLVSFLTTSESDRSITNASNYEFTLIATDTVETAKDVTARSATVDSFDDVDLYLYNMKNSADGTEGFAITSTDRRIGTVLAFVPQGAIEDVEENPFLEVFFDNLEEYIDETVEIWNDLSDEEITQSRESARGSYSKYGEGNEYYFSDFKYNTGNLAHILVTKWDQHSPFNDVINEIKNDGNSYPAGCGPIAMAQILTTIRPFSKCNLKGYTNVIFNWDKMVEPNYAFQGTNQKKYAVGSYYDNDTKHQVAVLSYLVGKYMKASYSTSGTNVKTGAAENFLSSFNIPYISSGYDYGLIQTSIDNACPIYIYGADEKTSKTKKYKIFGKTVFKTTNHSYSGHFFVIDGYANFKCTVTDSKENSTSLTTDFVHVNCGWQSLSDDGFYLSGIFNTKNTPYSDSRSKSTETTPGYYHWRLSGVYNIGIPIEEDDE